MLRQDVAVHHGDSRFERPCSVDSSDVFLGDSGDGVVGKHNSKSHCPLLPTPLTDAIVRSAMLELGQGNRDMLEMCIDLFRRKRMSAVDVVGVAKSMASMSRVLATLFRTPGTVRSSKCLQRESALDQVLEEEISTADCFHLASLHDMAELSLLGIKVTQHACVSSGKHRPEFKHALAEESVEDGDELVAALKKWSRVHHRPARGQVTLKGHASHITGMSALLCVSQGCISVMGGQELDQTLLNPLPCSHAVLEPVSDRSNFGFYIRVSLDYDSREGMGGIFISLPKRAVRDGWLLVLSEMNFKVKGWTAGVGVPNHPLTLYRLRACKKTERPFCNTGDLPLTRWLS